MSAAVRALLAPVGDGSEPAGEGVWLPGESLDAARPGRAGPPAGGPRWQPDRRAVVAAGIAVLIAALITGWWVLSSRPRELAVHTTGAGATAVLTSTAPSGAPAPAPSAGGSSSPARLVVDVAGKVRHPGVYELSPGARVVDAVTAAGGVRKGVSTTALNLAAPLRDGEQVLVGVRGAAPPGDAGGDAADTGSPALVDLNSATLEQLQSLPGVGPVLGQRILDWRATHGRFGSVDQLDEVSGIGPAKFA